MADKLVVLGFDGEHTAETVMDTIEGMRQRGLLELEDAVVVSRPAHTERLQLLASVDPALPMAIVRVDPSPSMQVEIKQTDSRRGRTAAVGASIGLLAGWLLGGPIGGAAIGALLGALRDRGIDDRFIKELGHQLHSDSSAIFLLVSRADTDKVLEEMRQYQGRVLHTTIAPEVEEALRKTLARGA